VNKADPDAAVDGFEVDVIQLLTDWAAIDLALTKESVSLRRRVATDALLRLAVNWEAFLSDWWVSSVNRDTGPLLAGLDAQVRKFAETKCGLSNADLSTNVITRSHFTLDDVRRMLDPEGQNIVLRSRSELRKRAQSELGNPYLMKVLGISTTDWVVANLVRTMRNALAHRSRRSFDELDRVLRSGDLPAALRLTTSQRLDFRGIGRYLGVRPNGSTVERIATIHDRMRLLAGKLRT
jgi:hypothetical protein